MAPTGSDDPARPVDAAAGRPGDDRDRALPRPGSSASAASRSQTTTAQRWSVDDLAGFWSSIWEFFEVKAHAPYATVLASDAMPGASWFPGARLNFAEHLIGADDDSTEVAVDRALADARTDRAHVRRAPRADRPRARGPLAARRRPGRPRGRVHAEHPRDAGRVRGGREPRRGLGELRAGARRAQRHRPPRAARAGGAARRRRLRLPRPLDRPPRRGGDDPRRPSRRCATSCTSPTASTRCPTRSRWDELLAEPAPLAFDCPSRSTTRSSCSSRRGRPAGRRRSSTGTAASCSSSRRRTRSAGT